MIKKGDDRLFTKVGKESGELNRSRRRAKGDTLQLFWGCITRVHDPYSRREGSIGREDKRRGDGGGSYIKVPCITRGIGI